MSIPKETYAKCFRARFGDLRRGGNPSTTIITLESYSDNYARFREGAVSKNDCFASLPDRLVA